MSVWICPVLNQKGNNIIIAMPKGAETVCFAVQRGELFLWARVDSTELLEKREFQLVGTGHQIVGYREDFNYVGTAFLNEGAIVFHLFEKRP